MYIYILALSSKFQILMYIYNSIIIRVSDLMYIYNNIIIRVSDFNVHI